MHIFRLNYFLRLSFSKVVFQVFLNFKMSKRRRASSVASRGADGDDSDDGGEHSSHIAPSSGRKRKKLDPVPVCLFTNFKIGNICLLLYF